MHRKVHPLNIFPQADSLNLKGENHKTRTFDLDVFPPRLSSVNSEVVQLKLAGEANNNSTKNGRAVVVQSTCCTVMY